MRIGARRTASPASVVRVAVVTGWFVSAVTFTCSASAADSFSSSVIGQRIGDRQRLHRRLERRRLRLQRVAAGRDVGDAELAVATP